MPPESEAPKRAGCGIGYLVAGLLYLAAAILLWWHWLSVLLWMRGPELTLSLWPRAIVPLIATFCPPTLLLVGHFLSRTGPSGPWFKTLVILSCAIGPMIVLVFSFGFEFMIGWGCVANPQRYEERLGAFFGGTEGATQHFPRSIPSSATRVRFSYYPGPLQASEYLQLRVRLPPDEVEAILVKYGPVAIATYWGGDSAEAPGFPPAYFYTSEEAQNESDRCAEPFPDRFLILYLGPYDAVPEEKAWEAQKHPEGAMRPPISDSGWYGLAIDLSASEVVYWAEGG